MRFYSHLQPRTQEDTLTHTLRFSGLQGAHKRFSYTEASISLKEAKLLISDTMEDIVHKIKLKNKGLEASLRTSLQLSAAGQLPFSHTISAAPGHWTRLCFGREQTHERPRQGAGA